MDFEKLSELLRNPCGNSWRDVVRMGNVSLYGSSAAQEMFMHCLEQHLPSWPTELQRKCPDDWPDSWKNLARNDVREVDLYGTFASRISGDERLRLHDGMPGVRLTRRFVGDVRELHSDRRFKVGDKGAADLAGGMTLELRRTNVWHRLEVTLEVEVKRPDGKLRDEQSKRQRALELRGGVYIEARTVEEAVRDILEARRKAYTFAALRI